MGFRSEFQIAARSEQTRISHPHWEFRPDPYDGSGLVEEVVAQTGRVAVGECRKFLLRLFVEVRILEQRPPWVRVRLANGRDAWLPGSSLASVDGTP